MKPIPFLILILLPARLLAEPQAPDPSDLPRDAALQEQSILISAKMKNLAEMQDLIVQQQQLLLQHLDALRRDVAQLQRERTNAVTRSDLEGCLHKLDQLQKQFDNAQETTEQNVRKLVQSLLAKNPEEGPTVSTGQPKPAKLQSYRVQTGDTLLRILARLNEALEKENLPRLTQDQIERANPGLTPDKIRVGQILFIPWPEKP